MVCKVRISANSESEANKISDKLISQRLVAGCLITSGSSRYRWDGEIKQQKYYNIQCYTIKDHKQDVIDSVEDIHSDDVPIIEFISIDGNEGFLDWIVENVV